MTNLEIKAQEKAITEITLLKSALKVKAEIAEILTELDTQKGFGKKMLAENETRLAAYGEALAGIRYLKEYPEITQELLERKQAEFEVLFN